MRYSFCLFFLACVLAFLSFRRNTYGMFMISSVADLGIAWFNRMLMCRIEWNRFEFWWNWRTLYNLKSLVYLCTNTKNRIIFRKKKVLLSFRVNDFCLNASKFFSRWHHIFTTLYICSGILFLFHTRSVRACGYSVFMQISKYLSRKQEWRI